MTNKNTHNFCWCCCFCYCFRVCVYERACWLSLMSDYNFWCVHFQIMLVPFLRTHSSSQLMPLRLLFKHTIQIIFDFSFCLPFLSVLFIKAPLLFTVHCISHSRSVTHSPIRYGSGSLPLPICCFFTTVLCPTHVCLNARVPLSFTLDRSSSFPDFSRFESSSSSDYFILFIRV